MTEEEYKQTIENMMSEYGRTIEYLSYEAKELKTKNEQLVRENNFLRNQIKLRTAMTCEEEEAIEALLKKEENVK